jgi:hypothetical protein
MKFAATKTADQLAFAGAAPVRERPVTSSCLSLKTW